MTSAHAACSPLTLLAMSAGDYSEFRHAKHSGNAGTRLTNGSCLGEIVVLRTVSIRDNVILICLLIHNDGLLARLAKNSDARRRENDRLDVLAPGCRFGEAGTAAADRVDHRVGVRAHGSIHGHVYDARDALDGMVERTGGRRIGDLDDLDGGRAEFQLEVLLENLARAASRVTARTLKPATRSSAATLDPTRPVAFVTSTVVPRHNLGLRKEVYPYL